MENTRTSIRNRDKTEIIRYPGKGDDCLDHKRIEERNSATLEYLETKSGSFV